MKKPILVALVAASAFGLSGCMTDGYGSVGVGYGSGYGYDYYPGGSYWGWYDNYYYPGAGYYVYDRSGRRHAWSSSHRRYWEGRRGDRPARENWSGLRNRDGVTDQNWQARRDAWRAQRQQQGATNQGMTSQDRQAHREAWRAQRQQQGTTSRDSQRGDGTWWQGRRDRRGGD